MFESINDIINAIVTYILSWTGASTAGPQNPEFQLIRNGVIAIIVLFAIMAQWLARRIYIVRKIWDPRCKLEGYWIEEIRRGSSVFVTIVRLSFKNWTSRKYTIYGETWNFSNHPDEEIKIYAKFQSDAIHFDIGDDICLTFNYNSRIFGETIEQSIGLAQYHFTDQDKKVGLGWFVSVVDSDSRLKKDMHIDHCDLKKVGFLTWLKLAWKNKKIVVSYKDRYRFIAQDVYKSLKARQDRANSNLRDGSLHE